jgi:hypothetical protein
MNDTLFPFGHVVTSPGALAALQDAGQSALEFLERHGAGDWGEVGDDQREHNDRGLQRGLRLHSIYRTRRDAEVWCITEAGRTVTLLVLPDEYVYPGERRPARRNAGGRARDPQRL